MSTDSKEFKTYQLRWSPTAQVIGTVQATNPRLAIRKAPQPYRKYLGEIYAEELPPTPALG